MNRSATWHHSWVGFDDNDFPLLFAACDHYPTIADIEDVPGSVARITKVTDMAERKRLLDIHAGVTP